MILNQFGSGEIDKDVTERRPLKQMCVSILMLKISFQISIEWLAHSGNSFVTAS